MLVRLGKNTGHLQRRERGSNQRILLVVTPFCAPSYAYPAPAYLARYLRAQGVTVKQADLNLALMLTIFSRTGLERIFDAAANASSELSEQASGILDLRARYVSTVDTVIRFLQGRDHSIAYRLCQPGFLPRAETFDRDTTFDWHHGTQNTLIIQDRAKFVSTLYLYDIAALIRETIFPYFQITLVDRLYDSFVHFCTTFDSMHGELQRPPTIIDDMLAEVLDAELDAFAPHLVGASVPFARNLYWALRIAKRAHERVPAVKVALGGGLVNTSMREMREPRLFQYIDYLTLDDGEQPLMSILEHISGDRTARDLKRTFVLDDTGQICFCDGAVEPDASHTDSGAPDYSDYQVQNYLSTLETTNINQRLHCDGWWNKLTMAHGCYWRKCAFCDIHLSYIQDYEIAPAKNLVDKVEDCIAKTGHAGFHFVDEAMPPKVMRHFAHEVLRRGLHISWYGMVRFDKAFTRELCELLAAAGLINVMGGLEVASNRLLAMMKKGTTVEQIARVTKNFKEAGVRVHAFIMYGFPTQTAQETVDALDVVRQLFQCGLLTSATWSRFGVTPHSPAGREPHAYGITLDPVPPDTFLQQMLPHRDPSGADHDKFAAGLTHALAYYAVGKCFEVPAEHWFDFAVPNVSIDRELIAKIIAEPHQPEQLASRHVSPNVAQPEGSL